MNTAIRKWGNSQGVLLPKRLLNALRWSEDEEVSITVVEGRLVIERSRPEKPTIEALFRDYDGDYSPAEVDWGAPAGKEVW